MPNDFDYAAAKALNRSRGLVIALFVFALISCIHLFVMSNRIGHLLAGRIRSTNQSRALEIAKDSRLALTRFLLAGGEERVEHISRNTHALDAFPAQADPEVARIIEVYYSWLGRFAEPLIEKRRSLDAGRGHTTISQVELAYVQADPDEWEQRFAELSRPSPAEAEALQPGQSPEKKLYDEVAASLARPIFIGVLLVIATFVLAILALRSITQLHDRLSDHAMSAQTNG